MSTKKLVKGFCVGALLVGAINYMPINEPDHYAVSDKNIMTETIHLGNNLKLQATEYVYDKNDIVREGDFVSVVSERYDYEPTYERGESAPRYIKGEFDESDLGKLVFNQDGELVGYVNNVYDDRVTVTSLTMNE